MQNGIDEKNYRKKLKQQLVEAHGRVEYTYTAHHKICDRIVFLDKALRIAQIILTTISTGGFLATIITSQTVLCWIGGIAAALSLGLNLYMKDFKLFESAQRHKEAADALWEIRETYTSLLIDMEALKVEEIVHKRDILIERLSEINKCYPRTDRRGYKAAKNALVEEREQTFDKGEAEKFLPTSLRAK